MDDFIKSQPYFLSSSVFIALHCKKVTTSEIKDSSHSSPFVFLLGRFHIPKMNPCTELQKKQVPPGGTGEAIMLGRVTVR